MNYRTRKDLCKLEELLRVSEKIVKDDRDDALRESSANVTAGMVIGLPEPFFPFNLIWKMVTSKRDKERLRQHKESLLAEALRTRDAVIKKLSKKTDQAQKRIDKLTKINAALQDAIEKLSQDLS